MFERNLWILVGVCNAIAAFIPPADWITLLNALVAVYCFVCAYAAHEAAS